MNSIPQNIVNGHHIYFPAMANLLILIGAVFLLALFYRKILGLKREAAYLMSVVTMVAAIGAGVYVGNEPERLYGNGMDDQDIAVICAGLLALFGIPLAVRLYRGWIAGELTEAEKSPGAAGIRAWLSPVSLVLAVCVSICAAKGFGYSFVSVLFLTIGTLAAYPLLTTLSNPAPQQPAAAPAENLTAERDKVLSMLDAGKITAEESAELLNALGSTVKAVETRRMVISPQQRMVMIGAALVLIGFFLPWFRINTGEELARMTRQFSGIMNQFAPQMPGIQGNWNGQNPGDGQNSGPGGLTISIAGGDISHGLGWIVLIAAVGVAALPFVAAQLEERSLRTVSLVTLGVGSFILLYVLTQGVRFLSVGILLAAAGYAVEWIGAAKPGGAPHFSPSAAPHSL